MILTHDRTKRQMDVCLRNISVDMGNATPTISELATETDISEVITVTALNGLFKNYHLIEGMLYVAFDLLFRNGSLVSKK